MLLHALLVAQLIIISFTLVDIGQEGGTVVGIMVSVTDPMHVHEPEIVYPPLSQLVELSGELTEIQRVPSHLNLQSGVPVTVEAEVQELLS